MTFTRLQTVVAVGVSLVFLAVAGTDVRWPDARQVENQDDRLGAQMAARAGANAALQAMRTNPRWEDLAETWQGTLAGGASWSAEVVPLSEPDAAPLYRIDGTGVRGRHRESYHLTVEEVRMVGKEPTHGIPLLFAYTTDGNLAFLQPTFQWTVMGRPPRYGAWLAAQEGPLFTFGRAGSGRGLPQFKPSVGPPPATTHEHLMELQVSQTQAHWVDIPDPGPVLGRVEGGSLAPDGTVATGRSVSWYGLTGPALAADKDVVYAHAIHYQYQPASSPHLVSSPALLAYDSAKGTWSMVADSPSSAPGMQPDTSTLGVAGGVAYCLRADHKAMLWAQGRAWQTCPSPPPPTHGLYAWQGHLMTHTAPDGGTLSGFSPDRDLRCDEPDLTAQVLSPADRTFRTTVLRPHRSLRTRLLVSPPLDQPGLAPAPAVDAPIGAATLSTTYVPSAVPDARPTSEPVQALPSSLGGNQVAILGGDLVCFARVSLENYLPATPHPNRETTVLVHFDGRHWQMWPSGLHAVSTSPPEDDTSYPWITDGHRIQTENLAWAEYPGNVPLLRRYEPLLARRGEP